MQYFFRITIGNENFTAYQIHIPEIIIIPFDRKMRMDLNPKPVTNENWLEEYQKAVYRDMMSSYYSRGKEKMEDLKEVHTINEGNIVMVLDTNNHFMGKINYHYNEKEKIFAMMFLYVCGNRRDFFFQKKIKKYPRGAFIVWASALFLSLTLYGNDVENIITYPRVSIFKYLQESSATWVKLRKSNSYDSMIESLPEKNQIPKPFIISTMMDEDVDDIAVIVNFDNVMKILNTFR